MLRLSRRQAKEGQEITADQARGHSGTFVRARPELIRKATLCGILCTVSSASRKVCGVTRGCNFNSQPRGRSPPSRCALQSCPVQHLLAPAMPSYVRAGRNLFVTLWKLGIDVFRLSRRMPPAVSARLRWRETTIRFLLVHKSAHTHIHHDAQRQEDEQY